MVLPPHRRWSLADAGESIASTVLVELTAAHLASYIVVAIG